MTEKRTRCLPWKFVALPIVALTLLLAGIAAMLPRNQAADAAGAAGGNWTTYLANNARSSDNKAETTINAASAPNLKMHWSFQAGGYIYLNNISDQPIEANGMIYWGSRSEERRVGKECRS